MNKDRGSPIRVTKNVKEFIDNLRSTRRCKAVGTDKKLLTQLETFELIVRYFKINNKEYLELTKMELENV